jgi:hypothetical protein
MAYSAALKALMEAGEDLTFRDKVEILNDSAAWVDFSDYSPLIGKIKTTGDRTGHRVVSSTGSVSMTNDDLYWDYMDDPTDSDTTTLFGALATAFATGFRDRKIRLSLVIRLTDGSWEDASLGTFRIKDKTSDPHTSRTTLRLQGDVDYLKKIGAQSMSDGFRQYNNRPISFLAGEILRRIYPEGLSGNFTLPDRIQIPTSDGEPALSHWGKPPEMDTSGRWRNDITHKPTAMIFDSAQGNYLFVGICDELWRMDLDDEIWKLCGSFSNDDFEIRGIISMTPTRLLVVGWEYDQGARSQTIRTAQVLKASASLVPNDPAYNTTIFSGDFVIRDTYNTGAAGLIENRVGRVANNPRSGGIDHCHGINMPCPFPQWPHSGMGTSADNKTMAIVAGKLAQPASGDWTDFPMADDPHGLPTSEPCYLCYSSPSSASATKRPMLKVAFGHKPNIAFTQDFIDPALTDTPYCFVVETDGNPLGIRCTGQIRIVGYYGYSGLKRTISSAWVTGGRAPLHDLRYARNTSPAQDLLTWLETDWVETFVDIDGGGSTSSVVDPASRILLSGLYNDGSGNPLVSMTSVATLWTSGDNDFGADDSDYIPTHAIVVNYSNTTGNWLVQVLRADDVGSECFELFICDRGISSSSVSIGTSLYGWDSFTWDDTNDVFYFTERDTGRVCKLDISSSPLTATIDYLDNGQEPVTQSFWGMPQGGGNQMVLRTESSKLCIYGFMYPNLSRHFFEGYIWPAGRYYLWKHHPLLTDRVELFDEGARTAWEALGLLAEICDYQVGIDPEGVGFFSPLPESGDTPALTIDLDSAYQRHFKVLKGDGLASIINRSEFIPHETRLGTPSATLDMVGYLEDEDQLYYDGQTEIRSESTLEQSATLHCIKGGLATEAVFKYMIHELLVQTALREDTIIASAPRRLRVDNNEALETDMIVQIGDLEEDAAGELYTITSIGSTGDITLSADLTEDFDIGTIVIFRKASQATWSSDYATPLDYTTDDDWAEIADTGIFLKFTDATSSPHRFAVGDRILVKNPGQGLERSKTHKHTSEDTDSKVEHGLAEHNINNELMSFTIGKQRAAGLVSDEAQPHHGWKITGPLLLHAKVNRLITIKSTKLLPLATDNEELAVVKTAQHDPRKSSTEVVLRGLTSYK